MMRFAALALLPLVFLAFTSVSLGAPSLRPRGCVFSSCWPGALRDSTTTEASSSNGTTDAALPSLAPSLLSQTNETPATSSLAEFSTPSSASATSTTAAEESSPKRITQQEFGDADELKIKFDSESVTRLVEELSGQSSRVATEIIKAIEEQNAENMSKEAHCSICLDWLHADTFKTLKCEHSFHEKCLSRYIKSQWKKIVEKRVFECPISMTENTFNDISSSTTLQKCLEHFDNERWIPAKPEADSSDGYTPVSTLAAEFEREFIRHPMQVESPWLITTTYYSYLDLILGYRS